MKSAIARTIAALFCGVIFGLGLAVSQMVNPAKILNFLDVFGSWDPTLAVVMIGALIITIPAFRWVSQRPEPVTDANFHLPDNNSIDARLIAGAVLFGIGWGLAGLCPGPAIVATLSGLTAVFGFVAMLLAGSWLGNKLR